uniref:Uncharacterized protein AlNc14C161G7785 n=1 Tax=Albugo laibachii Nc14 TaxID=890382 RepID=F0WMU9_9STRA|nr:conserved hypothetical protein [Albugo laibachii Nc14]|eukprot:CCA22634.1 conserved hypothetical protein [Albugo laibachii Nc14]
MATHYPTQPPALPSPSLCSPRSLKRENPTGFSSVQVFPPEWSKVKLTLPQKHFYREEASVTLHHAIRSFQKFEQKHFAHPKQWKYIKRKQDVDIYRNRLIQKGNPPVLTAYGTIEGNTEDLVAAEYSDTDEKVRHKCDFVDSYAIRDVRVIENIETKEETQDHLNETYRYLGIKWVHTRLPILGLNFIAKSRDWLFWEAVGIVSVPYFSGNSPSTRIGYHIMRPCEMERLPPLPKVTRGRVGCVTLFYQKSPGRLQIFSQGSVGYTNETVSDTLATFATMSLVTRAFSMVRYVECQKLTMLSQEMAVKTRSRTATFNANTQKNTGVCGLCERRIHAMKRLTSQMKSCYICGLVVCSKCRVQKTILTEEGLVKARYCQQCLLASKMLANTLSTSQHNLSSSDDGTNERTNQAAHSIDSDPHLDSQAFDNQSPQLDQPIEANAKLSFDDLRGAKTRCSSFSMFYEKVDLTGPGTTFDTESEACQSLHEHTKASVKHPAPRSNAKATFHLSLTNPNSSSEDTLYNWKTRASSECDSSSMTCPIASGKHRMRLFRQMIALQRAAETAYNITQANRTMMDA